ncbi:MAG TPA: membrane protein insertion efficiency factor YidD [Vicinamibacterales bacterium]|nr:membrane protein insertion efficiency factor YidD [Vicinamibacterales bacterium]HPK72383.1 membrane protein insertion efficiency factor YidD [Vicinamibacterales bacterium]
MRWLARTVLLGAACAFALDASRPPARQVSAGAAVAGIRFYQTRLAPHAGPWTAVCRFTPTCSRYAERVIARDGILRGGWLAVKRIARCGPWTPAGTHDPP